MCFTTFVWQDVLTRKFKGSIPDFPDCSTEGENFVEAYVKAQTALESHFLDLGKNKKLIPEDLYVSASMQQAAVLIEEIFCSML